MNNPETVQTSELAPKPSTKRKGFRLFKRDAQCCELAADAVGYRERFYFFRFQFRGKNYVRCLETNDATEAQKRARLKANEIKEAVVREDYGRVAATKVRAPAAATVAEICKAYLAAPGDACSSTRRQNVQALQQFLRSAHPEASPDVAVNCSGSPILCYSLSSREINAALAQAWFQAADIKAQAAGDQSTEASLKKSANSRFVQASSLFTDRARDYYTSEQIDQPCFAEFLRAGNLHKFTRLPKDHYNPPGDHIIKATLAAWLALEDRNLFLAIGHELAFGLRKSEIAQAKWGWWTTREGYPVLDGVADVKNGTGFVQVRAVDPWFSAMRARVDAKSWRGGADEHIITGNFTFRSDDIFRAVSEWLRNLKWETMKTNHALRAYAGSQVAMRYGIYEAQCWLRHSTVKVTEQHYTHFIKRFRPADVDSLPARWATTQQPLELRILEPASA